MKALSVWTVRRTKIPALLKWWWWLRRLTTHKTPPPGPLLHAVQMLKIFKDSKTFVDMPMLHPPEKILSDFAKLPKPYTRQQIKGCKTTTKPPTTQIHAVFVWLRRAWIAIIIYQSSSPDFIARNFSPAGTEMSPITPRDWIESPPFLKSIDQPHLRLDSPKLQQKKHTKFT